LASELTTVTAALRRSPVYVAPSLASALPDPQRLVVAIRSAPVPVFAAIVPLVAGGPWPDAEHFTKAVHGRLGRKGVYLALDPNNDISAWEFGVDRDAIEAAGAINLDPTLDSASLSDRLIRCVGLITSGRAAQAYKKQSDALDERIKSDDDRRPAHHGGHAGAYALGGAGSVVVVAGAALLVWRSRRMPRVRRPRPALTAARSFAEVREHAAAELVALGEALEDAPGDAGRLQEALDAYSAAGKALDAARTVPDAAGVLVLVDMGRDAAEAARGGRREPSPLCFFNPLHGDGPVAVRWRAVGGRERITVRACGACARAVRAREAPDVLRDGATPYYEADPARSVWATTGYGQFRGDLVQRVLRGDLHRA
jgi:hypothetical protein